jgi:hypothetical protein
LPGRNLQTPDARFETQCLLDMTGTGLITCCGYESWLSCGLNMHECVGVLYSDVFRVKVAGDSLRMLDAGLELGVDWAEAVVGIIRREGTVL